MKPNRAFETPETTVTSTRHHIPYSVNSQIRELSQVLLLLLLLLLLTANCISAEKARPQHSHLVTCVKIITEQFFDPTRTLVVSLPNDGYLTEPAVDFAEFSHVFGDKDSTQKISTFTHLLEELHSTYRPIVICGPRTAMCQPVPKITPLPTVPPDFKYAKDIPKDEFPIFGPCYFQDKYDSYILWTNDTLSRQLQQLKAYPNSWNPRGKFLVVLERVNEVPTVLEEMRQWKVLNVVVLVPASSDRNTFDLYTWFPYQPPSGECGKLRETVLVNKCTAKEGYLLRNISLFPPKIPKDLAGCPITVSTLPSEPHVMTSIDREERQPEADVKYADGLDIRLLNFVTQRLNASARFLPPPDGQWWIIYANNTWGGISGDLVYGRADLGMCGTTYGYAMTPDLDFTVPYETLDAVFVVPRAKQHPRWNSITRVFDLPTWLLLITVMIVAAVTMLCLANYGTNYSEEQPDYRSMSGCLSSAWAAMLGVSVPRQPRSAPMRSFFIMWLIYSLAVSTVFQTFVSSFLVDPGREKQISTVDDILNSGFRYGMPRTFLTLLYSLPEDQMKVMTRHAKIYPKVADCAKKVAEEGNFVTILQTVTVEYLNTYQTLDETGAGLLYMLKDIKLWMNFQVFLLPKGSDLLKPFNKLMTAAQESGLVAHFWQDILRTSALKSGSLRIHTPLDDYKVFTLTYLQSAFFLLLVGHVCAFCLLVVELSCHWYAERQHKMAVKRRRQRRTTKSNRNLVALRKELF